MRQDLLGLLNLDSSSSHLGRFRDPDRGLVVRTFSHQSSGAGRAQTATTTILSE
jgi:hypothetical protein